LADDLLRRRTLPSAPASSGRWAGHSHGRKPRSLAAQPS